MAAVLDQRKVWTREDIARLSELFPNERLELIEGDLIEKMGQKPLHAYVVALLTQLLMTAFPERVRSQTSININDPKSEPEPDVVVLHSSIREFFDSHPSPIDIALVIEVADTSLAMDREVKYRLYARAGIAEYWIVDLVNRRTIVCRRPDGEEYRSVIIYDGREEFSLNESFRCSTAELLPDK